MLLPSSQTWFRKFLLILVLKLLLCENVTSLPANVHEAGHGEVYLQDIFDHAIMLSFNINELNIEMRKMFFLSDFSSNTFIKFLLAVHKDKENMPKMFNSCHSLPMNIPKTIQEARMLALEDFLKIILTLMGTWSDPLHYQVIKLSQMTDDKAAIVSIAKDIEAQNKKLIKVTKWILETVHPGIENEVYDKWPDLESLQAADEKTSLSALFKLSLCLGADTKKAVLTLRYLICTFIGGDTCSPSRLKYDRYDPLL